MAKNPNQKLKILYVLQYLQHNSDEAHPVSIKQLIAYLLTQGIPAERKSLYDDLEALRLFGLDIVTTKTGGQTGYYLGSRDFELPELKLLVDSVQASKFITHKKTLSLIQKLEGLTSRYEAQQLNRQVFVKNRIKTMNESIYYNVDRIHTAIAQNRQLRFRYFDYTVTKERRFRKNNGFYIVSPLALTWDDENYYLVAYDAAAGIRKHYRVDKMTDLTPLETERDAACPPPDMAVYSRKVFGMFGGEEKLVRMRFENQLVGVALDRLGRDVTLIPDGDDHFTVAVPVAVSPQFFAWVCGLGPQARIIGPPEVVEKMAQHLASVLALYPSTAP